MSARVSWAFFENHPQTYKNGTEFRMNISLKIPLTNIKATKCSRRRDVKTNIDATGPKNVEYSDVKCVQAPIAEPIAKAMKTIDRISDTTKP
jgi:hypothetical protein